DMNVEPVITLEGVEALAQHRGARRLRSLVLTYNNLDNDAARTLLRSPYLVNLKRLDLLEGNRFRGEMWARLRERFGEDVVGRSTQRNRPMLSMLLVVLLPPAAEAKFTAKYEKLAPPATLAEPVRKLLADEALVVRGDKDDAVMRVWFRTEIPAKATP